MRTVTLNEIYSAIKNKAIEASQYTHHYAVTFRQLHRVEVDDIESCKIDEIIYQEKYKVYVLVARSSDGYRVQEAFVCFFEEMPFMFYSCSGRSGRDQSKLLITDKAVYKKASEYVSSFEEAEIDLNNTEIGADTPIYCCELFDMAGGSCVTEIGHYLQLPLTDATSVADKFHLLMKMDNLGGGRSSNLFPGMYACVFRDEATHEYKEFLRSQEYIVRNGCIMRRVDYSFSEAQIRASDEIWALWAKRVSTVGRYPEYVMYELFNGTLPRQQLEEIFEV